MSNLLYNSSFLEKRFPHIKIKLETLETEKRTQLGLCEEPIEKDVAWLQAVENSIKDCKIVFVYGFGRGLGIADLLDQYPDRWFFVYEPNESLFLPDNFRI
ncbi:hypothetical protein [Paenibacillus sp. DMB20]|uniref:hypothetical protein n=1 Tax=Paenibacillus sp. DMB20 TaxID=1642570 RepID=UPI001F410E5C|nr:hypothetical protein [Paenibacillus sp. DMB20]